MTIHFPSPKWKPLLVLLALSGANGGSQAFASHQVERSEANASTEPEAALSFFQDLLPTAWQKRPKLFFNVYTEMTLEGRKWRTPTPEQPLYYTSSSAAYREIGWLPIAGERPPPWRELEGAMRRALAANGFSRTTDESQRPDILIVFNFGSHSTDLAMLDSTARAVLGEVPAAGVWTTSSEELVNLVLLDRTAVMDVLARARFVAGPRVAEELAEAIRGEIRHREMNRNGAGLPVAPNPLSPFGQLLMRSKRSTYNALQLAFRPCYFVTATAYDFAGVEKKQKVLLWQTRMTIETQGVTMDEVLRPLIINTAEFVGRETPEGVMIEKRLDREGRVEIGTATVVEEAKPSAPNSADRP